MMTALLIVTDQRLQRTTHIACESNQMPIKFWNKPHRRHTAAPAAHRQALKSAWMSSSPCRQLCLTAGAGVNFHTSAEHNTSPLQQSGN